MSLGQEVAELRDLFVTTITHTGGANSFLDALGMKAGSFSAVVDLAAPRKRDSFAMHDCVAIDDLKQEVTLLNVLCDPAFIRGDLTGLVMWQLRGRTDQSDRTAFVFRGHSLGDLALSALVIAVHRTH